MWTEYFVFGMQKRMKRDNVENIYTGFTFEAQIFLNLHSVGSFQTIKEGANAGGSLTVELNFQI